MSAPNSEDPLTERGAAKITNCGSALEQWQTWAAMDKHNRRAMKKKPGHLRNMPQSAAQWANLDTVQKWVAFREVASSRGSWAFLCGNTRRLDPGSSAPPPPAPGTAACTNSRPLQTAFMKAPPAPPANITASYASASQLPPRSCSPPPGDWAPPRRDAPAAPSKCSPSNGTSSKAAFVHPPATSQPSAPNPGPRLHEFPVKAPPARRNAAEAAPVAATIPRVGATLAPSVAPTLVAAACPPEWRFGRGRTHVPAPAPGELQPFKLDNVTIRIVTAGYVNRCPSERPYNRANKAVWRQRPSTFNL